MLDLKNEVLNDVTSVKRDFVDLQSKFSEDLTEHKNEVLKVTEKFMDEKKEFIHLKGDCMDLHSKFSEVLQEFNIMKAKLIELSEPMPMFSVSGSGVLPADSYIHFDHSLIENGMNFDLANGIFEAPQKGDYEFSFTGHTPYDKRSFINVLKNGSEILALLSRSKDYNTISSSWIVSLGAGDSIRLKLDHNTHLYTDGNTWRIFTGKLLSKYYNKIIGQS